MNEWPADLVHWKCGDRLYLSVVFSWQLEEAEAMAVAHKGKVFVGGPAIRERVDWADSREFDAPWEPLLFHNPAATFTTRGCPNRCPWCIVPDIEGDFRELESWRPAPIVCDNNLLACTKGHFEKVIDSLRPFPACDFNQGLSARLFTSWHAGLMASLRNPIVRFSFDTANAESTVADALAMAQAAGLPQPRVYVLVGFNDTPAEARHRCEWVLQQGALPCPMRYQPKDTKRKNSYVSPSWTDYELKRLVRYFWRPYFYNTIPYDEYEGSGMEGELLFDDLRPSPAAKGGDGE